MPLLVTAAANLSESKAGSQRALSPTVLAGALWLAAIAVAFALDRSLATALRDSGIADRIKSAGWPRHAAKFAGYYWFPLALSIVLLIWHPLQWRAALFMVLCALVGGTNSILKWLVGRYRPFKLPPFDVPQPFHCVPFNGGLTGLFHQQGDLSFVSGHTALAFATAAGVAMLFSKRPSIVSLAYSIALIVMLERVGENAHWLSDGVCGAALGVWGVALLHKYFKRLLLPANA